jgi:hypothetical protein
MLVRLLYVSRPLAPINKEALDTILAQSRAHNPALGITGILCYGGDVFMQLLEGGREQVNRLYNQIVTDNRHTDVTVLHYEEITERRFASWTMGQVNLEKLNPAILLKYSERPVLNPYAVSGAVSIALLTELISTAAIVGRVDSNRSSN